MVASKLAAAPGPEVALEGALGRWLSPVISRAVITCALQKTRSSPAQLQAQGLTPELVAALVKGIAVFCKDRQALAECEAAIRGLVAPQPAAAGEPQVVPIHTEEDVMRARSATRSLAVGLGFDPIDQQRLVTAVSELARNIFAYARAGKVTLTPTQPRPGLRIDAEDEGPGIARLQEILEGRYHSRTGMGLGLLGCKRLMDAFSVQCAPARPRGTLVSATKYVR